MWPPWWRWWCWRFCRDHAAQAFSDQEASASAVIDWARAGIVRFILVAAIANVVIKSHFAHVSDQFPFIGTAVWAAILLSAPLRRPDWDLLLEAFKGSVFLLSLILCASLMPVEKLRAAS